MINILLNSELTNKYYEMDKDAKWPQWRKLS